MKQSSKRMLHRVWALTLALVIALTSTALARYETLEFGSKGSDVLKLQKALIALGFDPNGADGKFGRGTEKAVTAYQKSRGLEADGKAGNLTLTKMYAEYDKVLSDGSSSSGSIVTTNPNTLKYGDSGERVREMQTALKKLGYYASSVDGRFGAGTQRAVIAFQKACGLTADGLAGKKTLELLYAKANSSGGSSSSSSSSGLTRTLRRGYTGDDVVMVQNRLKALGYYSGSIDGVYGLGCIEATKNFQKRNGLSADGLMGVKSYAVLISSSAVAAGSSGSSSSGSSGSTTYVKLQSGDKGDDVRKLQRALKDLGYNVGVDGSYGPLTVSAVKTFQQINGLTADGIAGAKTQGVLYSGSAKKYTSSGSSSGSSSNNYGSIKGPNRSEVKLLHWFDDIKPTLKTGQNLLVYEPKSGISFTLYVMSRGRHCDVEPLTAEDTDRMMAAWDNVVTWTPKVVYVQLPDGRWSLATMHNVAHGSQVIGSSNNFDGQNCVHFLRDMDECKKNDPDYGVTNQNAIRKAWKELTGITVN